MQKLLRIKRHMKVRKSISGTSKKPRLAVFRSDKHIYAQIIDDTTHKTYLSESDINGKAAKSEKAFEVGKRLAQKAVALKIREVVFDRGGFLYHGRVMKLAEGARAGGLKF